MYTCPCIHIHTRRTHMLHGDIIHMCAYMARTESEHIEHVHGYMSHVPIQHIRENRNRLAMVAHLLISVLGMGRHKDEEFKASLSFMRLPQNKATNERECMNVHIIYTSCYVPLYAHIQHTEICWNMYHILHMYHTCHMCRLR